MCMVMFERQIMCKGQLVCKKKTGDVWKTCCIQNWWCVGLLADHYCFRCQKVFSVLYAGLEWCGE